MVKHWINLLRVLFTVVILGFCLLLLYGGRSLFHAKSDRLRIPLEQVAVYQTQRDADLVLESLLETGAGKRSATITGSWSQFRGNDRTGISDAAIPLSESNPKRVWSIPVGQGYAGVAIHAGALYLIDHDEKLSRDRLRCISPDDGQDIWTFSWPIKILSDHGITRTVPAVNDRYCIGISPKCQAFCVDAMTGEKKWLIDLPSRYGTKVPNWYAGQCALLVEEVDGRSTAVLAPGGPDALLVALDCETGEERWRTINPFGWEMTHVSLVSMQLGDKATYIYCGSGGVVGIDAHTGKLLWGTTAWKIVQATCPSPLVLPGNKIFLCGGYGAGSLLLEVIPDETGWRTKVLKRLKESEFGSTQQTPIWYNNHIWGVGRSARKFVCLDEQANPLWRSRTKTDFGDGPYIIADNKIWAINDDGLLVVAMVDPEKWVPLGEVQVIDGHECWGPPAIATGRLFLRSLDELICVDIRHEK